MMTRTDIHLNTLIRQTSQIMITFVAMIEPRLRKAGTAMISRITRGQRATTLSGESVKSSTRHQFLPLCPTVPSAGLRPYKRLLPSPSDRSSYRDITDAGISASNQ